MKKFELWYPVNPFFLNQGFGNVSPMYTNLHLKGHNGWDFGVNDWQVVRASHDGVVTYAGEDGSNGLLVTVRTTEKFDKPPAGTLGTEGMDIPEECYYKTVYGHLKKGTFKVKPNDLVKVGDVLAQADNTGMSTSTHLHFGFKPVLQGEQDWWWFNLVQENGYNGAIDPSGFWNKYFAKDALTVTQIMKQVIINLSSLIAKVGGKS